MKPCEACGGRGLDTPPREEHRGKLLCTYCQGYWRDLEKWLGREVAFKDFKDPPTTECLKKL